MQIRGSRQSKCTSSEHTNLIENSRRSIKCLTSRGYDGGITRLPHRPEVIQISIWQYLNRGVVGNSYDSIMQLLSTSKEAYREGWCLLVLFQAHLWVLRMMSESKVVPLLSSCTNLNLPPSFPIGAVFTKTHVMHAGVFPATGMPVLAATARRLRCTGALEWDLESSSARES